MKHMEAARVLRLTWVARQRRAQCPERESEDESASCGKRVLVLRFSLRAPPLCGAQASPSLLSHNSGYENTGRRPAFMGSMVAKTIAVRV